MRDLTYTRVHLVQERTCLVYRVQKVLEVAGMKPPNMHIYVN